MSPLLSIYTVPQAQQGILKRQPPDAIPVPESVLYGIAARFGERLSPEDAVQKILQDIRQRGDAALFEWSQKIDQARLESLAVDPAQITAAAAQIPAEVNTALAFAADRIRRFHHQQPKISWIESSAAGILGQVVRPIERVGIYVPGGTAPLPSTLLMCAIPAQVAGVKEIMVCSPAADHPVILQAAATVGVHKLYRLGGAQAIGAMAYGTATIPKVDKIVGPGGLFVTIAKRQVYGTVGIDGILGPTETLIIADASADPDLAAADMLAQAEHDVLASAILLTPSQSLAEAVQTAVEKRLASLDRREILHASLTTNSGIVIVDDLPQAFDLANRYAPEHLCLLLKDAYQWLGAVQHAGGVFLGEQSYEVLGDYVAGPSHSMPTGGSARFASPLNVLDFVKIVSVVGLNAQPELSRQAAILARAEALGAHAAAAEARRASS
jgi:histidinol dehydrogenase